MKIILLIVINFICLVANCQTSLVPNSIHLECNISQPYLKYSNHLNEEYDIENKSSIIINIPNGCCWGELISTNYKRKSVYWLRTNENYYLVKYKNTYYITSKNKQAQVEANFLAKLDSLCIKYSGDITDELLELKKCKNATYRDSVRLLHLSIGLSFLNTLYTNNEISDNFHQLCKSYLYIKYYVHPSFNSKIQTEEDLRRLKRLQNDELLFTSLYRNYLSFIAVKDSLKGQSYEYAYFNSILKAFNKNDSSFKRKAYAFINISKNKQQNEYITNLLKQQNRQVNGMITDFFNKKLSFNDLIKENKGKAIYIDFWASWCTPCKEEIPLSLKIRNNHPDVVFIYLSIDKDINTWKNTIAYLGMDPKSCYIIDAASNSSVLKNYKISSIPHYLLFDKTGKLINPSAPRPSSTLDLSAQLKKIKQQ